ncbi:IclR family transcriptional regulator [uncultured Oscillibacter sp.]|uniref:IclR family transcriptional regulator n=1 Tax=uncultured Oscillibacter sp. TaxID=876091 RepID=UPI0025F78C78|nr:IclR family transcriptional regulator [uncultured Oscillibacter sp.]
MMDHLSKSSVNQSVYSAIEIINYLAGKGWCRVKDIAAALQMDPAKIHRILKTMQIFNYIEYSRETRRYRLGMAFFSIVYHMTKAESLLSMVRQPLEALAKKTSENVNFYILSDLDHSKIVNLYRIENNLPIANVEEGVGESEFIYTAAGGKCLLAYLPLHEQREIAARLTYIKCTDATITSPEMLLEELNTIRLNGYAMDRGEYHPDVYCIALPVFSAAGEIYASVSISSSRDLQNNLTYYRDMIADTIRRLTLLP